MPLGVAVDRYEELDALGVREVEIRDENATRLDHVVFDLDPHGLANVDDGGDGAFLGPHAHGPQTRPLWVAQRTDSGQLDGWVSFSDFYGRPAYRATAEVSIYLDESARGKGLGKQLLAASLICDPPAPAPVLPERCARHCPR